MNILNKSWKRNVGSTVAVVFTFCKANGIELPIGEKDVADIGQASGIILAGIGTLHDYGKKIFAWIKAKKEPK